MFGVKGAGAGQGPPVQFQQHPRLAPDNSSGHRWQYMANAKTPPSWSTEWAATHHLWIYVQDVLWSPATEAPVNRQGPASALQLGSVARALGRDRNIQEPQDGRTYWDYFQNHMVHISGITTLLSHLLRRLGGLDEEQRMRVASQLFGVTRMQGETVDQTVSRFEVAICRATYLLNKFEMVLQGLAWILLRPDRAVTTPDAIARAVADDGRRCDVR